MKTKLAVVLAASTVASALMLRGETPVANPRPVAATAVVTFVHPEKFTDVKMTDYSIEKSRAILLPKIEKVIQEQTKKSLAAGSQLDVKILDIDEAGESLPAGTLSRRVVTETSLPARVDLEFTLTDSAGKAVKSGHRTLSQLLNGITEAGERFDSARTSVLYDMLRSWVDSLAK